MALADKVQEVVGAQLLKSITNAYGSTAATSIDSDRLTAVCNQVIARFERVLQPTTFDIDNDEHVELAVEGVVARLKLLMGHGGRGAWSAWKADLLAARPRVTPQTNSRYLPTKPPANSIPPLDPAKLRGYRVRLPSQQGGSSA